MARITGCIGGIGVSHSPTIGVAEDTNEHNDPAWKPIFDGFDVAGKWVQDTEIDVILLIYTDHVTSFYVDQYPFFSLGIDDTDEAGGRREVPPAQGHPGLSQHIAIALAAEAFDMSYFQGKPVDHGMLSPLGMLGDADGPWPGKVVPVQCGRLHLPIPPPRRMWKPGKSLKKEIESYPEDLRVSVMATGGLSHQVHGERAGFINEDRDDQFLALIEKDPQTLVDMRLADDVVSGGMEGAEVIMWLIMGGALSNDVMLLHKHTCARSVTNIATMVLEDLSGEPDAAEIAACRAHIGDHDQGADQVEGTHPFTHARSRAAFRDETLDAFLATRKAPIKYPVAGGDKAK